MAKWWKLRKGKVVGNGEGLRDGKWGRGKG
jgi:hypothetical protein